ncbi:uncharacterized protein F5147DRAFT_792909 [Suillus discolor]|uniref:RSE1/DDB1/CPSF1 first beta-propeller domain-containing protein n=1 Tax=Suillus discolor TaxID=1912936 RepID=A0A9P7EQV4_9AGAM|nr:uncharacterized protein F5147DRAFT_792909 [Suillus discolor]KAG2085528.1 hypothetical protein F5147DRAFT_792909 [Suillus discolor]
MDEGGEGWVNMGSVKATAKKDPSMVSRFHFVREHTLHGTVTGMESMRIMSTYDDQLDRLLVSFKDTKIALLEWSDAAHDLVTISIHMYERAPQMVGSSFRTELRADPLSHCAALSLPKDAFTILPFFQTQAELDVMEQEQNHTRDIPYSPSFMLDLINNVDERIWNVIDFVFLPGYNNPTVAVLCQSEQTWAGRLKEYHVTTNGRGSVTPTRAPALPTPAPALLDSPRGGAPPAPRKTAVWTAMTPPPGAMTPPPGAMTPPLA